MQHEYIDRCLLESGVLKLNLLECLPQLYTIHDSTSNINIIGSRVDKLIQYANLLKKWNKFYSLTALTSADEMLKYHLLDGLTLMPYINNAKSIIDVGSGMGVPGVIIAIWYPHMQVVAIDSNNKKAVFLRQVAIELGLTNFTVLNQRVEDYQPNYGYDVITSRAFADINLFIQLTRHLINQDGCWLAMKGANVAKEINILSNDNCNYSLDILPVNIPNSNLERFLIRVVLNNKK